MSMKFLIVSMVLFIWSVPAAGVEDKERKLLPVPDKPGQRKAEEAVKEVLKGEFARAKTWDQKVALAKVLIKYGVETKDDPTARFVLLRVARDQAAELGAFVTAFTAVDEMARWYEINPLEMKADVLARGPKRLPAQAETLAGHALALINAAIADDQYEVANRVGSLALSAAGTSGNQYLLQRAKERIGQIEKSRKAYEAAKSSLEVLKEHPDDAAANLTAGKYLCFGKDEWAKGLPLLAKGDDKSLAQVAAQDAANPKTASEQVKLADAWHDLVGSEAGPSKYKLLLRAHHWYVEALPSLTGLPRAKVVKRLDDIEEALESSPLPKRKPEIHIVADIDGSDTLRISAYEAVWTHLNYAWPSNVEINDLTWKPAEKAQNERAQNPKAGTWLLLGRKVDFASARLYKIKGRGSVGLKRAKDQIEISFDDPPFGSDIYEVIVTFGKGKTR
jgi:hypothetical protein